MIVPKDQPDHNLENLKYDNTVKRIWQIVVEIGAKKPESEWAKVPSDLSKNFDSYQSSFNCH